MTNDLKDNKHSNELKTKMSHLANSNVIAYQRTKNYLKNIKFSKGYGKAKTL